MRMRSRLTQFALVCLATGFGCKSKSESGSPPPAVPLVNAGPERDPAGAYITSVFVSQLGEAPRMGWFFRGSFLAGERYDHVYILASNRALVDGQFERMTSTTEHDSITHDAAIACESHAPLAVYRPSAAPTDKEDRALFLSRPLSAVAGFHLRPLTPAEHAQAVGGLDVGQTPAIYRDSAIEVEGSKAYYTVVAAYDSSTHQLLVTELALHDSAGRVLGSQARDTTDYDCDGCSSPDLEVGLRFLYPWVNGFTLQGFPYPVLLLDTGTVEGRALSLVTFTPKGGYSESRTYEYVVDCIEAP